MPQLSIPTLPPANIGGESFFPEVEADGGAFGPTDMKDLAALQEKRIKLLLNSAEAWHKEVEFWRSMVDLLTWDDQMQPRLPTEQTDALRSWVIPVQLKNDPEKRIVHHKVYETHLGRARWSFELWRRTTQPAPDQELPDPRFDVLDLRVCDGILVKATLVSESEISKFLHYWADRAVGRLERATASL